MNWGRTKTWQVPVSERTAQVPGPQSKQIIAPLYMYRPAEES